MRAINFHIYFNCKFDYELISIFYVQKSYTFFLHLWKQKLVYNCIDCVSICSFVQQHKNEKYSYQNYIVVFKKISEKIADFLHLLIPWYTMHFPYIWAYNLQWPIIIQCCAFKPWLAFWIFELTHAKMQGKSCCSWIKSDFVYTLHSFELNFGLSDIKWPSKSLNFKTFENQSSFLPLEMCETVVSMKTSKTFI